MFLIVFFFIASASTEISTLSLHDALPICTSSGGVAARGESANGDGVVASSTTGPGVFAASTTETAVYGLSGGGAVRGLAARSEEHTSELQSRRDLVCRLLLEKKN